MQVEEKYPELSKLIQTGKERGFIMYEELYEKLPEEVTGIAEELDDIYMRLSELDIDVVDSESTESGSETNSAATAQQAASDTIETVAIVHKITRCIVLLPRRQGGVRGRG